MIKNRPPMHGTLVGSVDWEDSLKQDMATHSSILAWRIPWTEAPGKSHGQRSLVGYIVHGAAKNQTRLSDGVRTRNCFTMSR